jgi:hypothetical protein
MFLLALSQKQNHGFPGSFLLLIVWKSDVGSRLGTPNPRRGREGGVRQKQGGDLE